MSSPQILLSRRVLRQIKPKYPSHFSPPKSSSSSKKSADETPWPKWMQIAGYGAVAIAIPYTIGVTIKESRSIRDYLEGDSNNDNGNTDSDSTMGRTIVNVVRWYWGDEDEIPYVEYLEKKNKSKGRSGDINGTDDENYKVEISIENEEKTMSRLNENRIERDCGSDIKVSIECDGISVQDGRVLKGNLPLGEQLSSGDVNIANTAKNIFVSFKDDDNNEDDSFKGDDSSISINLEESILSPDREIGALSTIYSTWNYFSPETINASTNNAPSIGATKSSSSSTFDPARLRIEELQHNMLELQKSLLDPSCTRDRDEMESEIREMRKEIGFLTRERRMAKLKRLLPF